MCDESIVDERYMHIKCSSIILPVHAYTAIYSLHLSVEAAKQFYTDVFCLVKLLFGY
jgi:hypothetical protein